MSFILQWIDLMWLPIGLASVHKPQRALSAGFFISCMIMMRLQIELMHSTGYSNGFTTLMTSDVSIRALVVYSLFYAIYIIMAVYSPKTTGTIYMAASISIFFAALFTSMIVMVI